MNFDGIFLYMATPLSPYISGAHKGLTRLKILQVTATQFLTSIFSPVYPKF